MTARMNFFSSNAFHFLDKQIGIKMVSAKLPQMILNDVGEKSHGGRFRVMTTTERAKEANVANTQKILANPRASVVVRLIKSRVDGESCSDNFSTGAVIE